MSKIYIPRKADNKENIKSLVTLLTIFAIPHSVKKRAKGMTQEKHEELVVRDLVFLLRKSGVGFEFTEESNEA